LLFQASNAQGSHFALRFLGEYVQPLRFVAWIGFSCGVVLMLAPWVFRALWPASLFPVILTATGLLIPFAGYYTGSTDIAKFFVIPVVVVGFFSAVMVDRQFRSRSPLRWATALAITVGCSASIVFIYPLIRDGSSLHWPTGFTRPASGPVLASEVAKRLLPAGRSIACAPELVGYCGTYGGFPQLNPDVITVVQGMYSTQIRQQYAWMAKLPASWTPLMRAGVRFLMVGPDSVAWRPRVSAWRKRGGIKLVHDYDGYQLWKLISRPPSSN
jgi:hypothetical protein